MDRIISTLGRVVLDIVRGMISFTHGFRRKITMPVYEYQCQDCGHQFEAEQRITEPKLKDCPECKKAALERLISATSFQLKGGGWYRDGYGDKKGKSSSDNDRIDRLGKAIEKDKKKSDAPEGGGDAPAAAASEAPASAPSGDGGGSSSSEKSQAA
jgi:putative FmdB family regulatory protein